tara:strand:- start:13415 stop:13654 length:240 start_codon:yes stop_codon:yes gene_type:complete
LIAVSIEALLTMFKAALGQVEYVIPAVLMMFAVVGLLLTLALYVYLGAKPEDVLMQGSTPQYKAIRVEFLVVNGFRYSH